MENQDETKFEQEQAKESNPLNKQQIEEDEILKSANEVKKDLEEHPEWIKQAEDGQEKPYDLFSDYFNDGYNLAKNDPELYDQVLWEAEGNKERSNALIWGRWMFEQEMKKDESQSKEAKALSEIRAI